MMIFLFLWVSLAPSPADGKSRHKMVPKRFLLWPLVKNALSGKGVTKITKRMTFGWAPEGQLRHFNTSSSAATFVGGKKTKPMAPSFEKLQQLLLRKTVKCLAAGGTDRMITAVD